jgi:hypothetical protein
LFSAIVAALGSVDITESSSVDDAREALELAAAGSSRGFDLCFVCLDLPPAPAGGVRLAESVLDAQIPLVLVTRSLRWIPSRAAALADTPWVRPEASAAEVSNAVLAATSAIAQLDRISWTSIEPRTLSAV